MSAHPFLLLLLLLWQLEVVIRKETLAGGFQTELKLFIACFIESVLIHGGVGVEEGELRRDQNALILLIPAHLTFLFHDLSVKFLDRGRLVSIRERLDFEAIEQVLIRRQPHTELLLQSLGSLGICF